MLFVISLNWLKWSYSDFDSWKGVVEEASGRANNLYGNVQIPGIQLGVGALVTWSSEIEGGGVYLTGGLGVDLPASIPSLFGSVEVSASNYKVYGTPATKTYMDADQKVQRHNMQQMKQELLAAGPYFLGLNGLVRDRAAATLDQFWENNQWYFTGPQYRLCREEARLRQN